VTHREKIIVKQCAQANPRILAGENLVSDTTNTETHLEIKKVVEERKLHRMANVHDRLVMWQDSQYLHATQKECHARTKQLTAVGYILDTPGIVKTSQSLF
jgi:hypothetical protein